MSKVIVSVHRATPPKPASAFNKCLSLWPALLDPLLIEPLAIVILAGWLAYSLTPGGMVATLGLFLLALLPAYWLITKGWPLLLLIPAYYFWL